MIDINYFEFGEYEKLYLKNTEKIKPILNFPIIKKIEKHLYIKILIYFNILKFYIKTKNQNF